MINKITDEMKVYALQKYARHLLHLIDASKENDSDFLKTEEGDFFIKSLLFATGIAEQCADSFKIQLSPDFKIEYEQHIEVLIEHSQLINSMHKESKGIDTSSIYIKFASDLAQEQAKAIALIAAKEFKALTNIEERGVVEIENVELANTDKLISGPGFNPTNQATKILNDLCNPKLTSVNIT